MTEPLADHESDSPWKMLLIGISVGFVMGVAFTAFLLALPR